MQNLINFYLIGIGGISMSAIAELLLSEGYIVKGSDLKESKITKRLEDKGIEVFYSHNAKNVVDADVVVYSSAIDENNEELKKAKELGLLIISRGEMLAKIAAEYKNVISVSGSHGKTTTTAMIASIFLTAGLNPTFHIGGELVRTCSNVHIGSKEYFITEACEYKDNFLYLQSTLAVITNIEAEHLDYFKTYDNVIASFNKFANNSKVVVSSENYKNKYGKEFLLKNIKEHKNGNYSFDVYKDKEKYIHIKLNIPLKYNVYNALNAIIACDYFNIDKQDIKLGLENYKGVKRRFEVKNYQGINIVFDYAHHPTEISNVLSEIKKITDKNIYVIFQPHTYTRTYNFMNDFVNSLSLGDKLAIYKTYPAREEVIEGGNGIDLFNNLVLNGKDCIYIEDMIYIHKILSTLKKDDYLLILGAGDIYDIVNRILFNS